jgi:hypothetical protein
MKLIFILTSILAYVFTAEALSIPHANSDFSINSLFKRKGGGGGGRGGGSRFILQILKDNSY